MLPAISTAAAPAGAAIGWLCGRKKRQAEGIEQLQETVNHLIAKNCEMAKEIIELRQANINLIAQVSELTKENNRLSNALENIRITISKKK